MASIPSRIAPLAAASALVACLLCACGGGGDEAVLQLPNSDLEGTRAASGSAIDADNVSRLEERWSFALTAQPTFSGIFAST